MSSEIFSSYAYEIVSSDLVMPHKADWEKKALEIYPTAHTNRRAEWVLGRLALAQAFKKFNLQLNPEHVIIDFHKVENFSDYVFSLSHTHHFGVAWLVPRTLVKCIGIDAEKSDREVSPQVMEKLNHASDFQAADLVKWTAKEAIYKCLPPEIQKVIWLNRIILKVDHFTVEGHESSGAWTYQETDQLIIARAILF